MIPQEYIDFALLKKSQGPEIEVEIRFKRLKNRHYNNLLKFLNEYTKPVTENIEEWIFNNFRKKNIDRFQLWLEKKEIRKYVNTDYLFNFVVSSETMINPIPAFQPKLSRSIKRLSYKLCNDTVKCDLSYVITERDNEKNRKEGYECELEFSVEGFKYLNLLLNRFLRVINDNTLYLFTFQEGQTIKNEIYKVIDFKSMNQPVLLKYEHFTSMMNPEIGYRVSRKADGQRRLLVFKNGVWLFYFPDILQRVQRESNKLFEGAILDGELLEDVTGELKNNFYNYIAFDCISKYDLGTGEFDNSIREKNHDERLRYCQVIAEHYKDNRYLFVFLKSFYSFDGAEDFFARVREIFRENHFIHYKQDGLLFVPQNSPYNFTQYKWKPPELLSVDLLYRSGSLWANHDRPVNMPVENSPMLKSGEIIEFVYRDGKLVPYRIRSDKVYPNNHEVVMETIKYMKNPITVEVISGETFQFMKKYHKRIKKRLYDIPLEKKKILSIGKKLEKADVITMFNPKRAETPEAILENLEYRGYLLFMFMDGNVVDQVFNPKLTGPVLENELKIGDNGKIVYRPPGKVLIDIPGFIQKEQNLFYIQELATSLMPSLTLVHVSLANDEKFLSAKEYLVSRFYVYGYFVRFDDDKREIMEGTETTLIYCMIDPDIPELHAILKARYASYREIPSGHRNRWLMGLDFKERHGKDLEKISEVVGRKIVVYDEKDNIIKSFGNKKSEIKIKSPGFLIK
jgi:hypothetical protein